jgi:hypothetical protein
VVSQLATQTLAAPTSFRMLGAMGTYVFGVLLAGAVITLTGPRAALAVSAIATVAAIAGSRALSSEPSDA